MSTSVIVVDYGVGNLRSVKRALEEVGANVTITSDHATIRRADRLVLPGVGAFGHCMAELSARHLNETLCDYARSERPLLGICVGMQILFSSSEEFGHHSGLGLLAGSVKKIPPLTAENKPRILPFIGWAALKKASETATWHGTALERIHPGDYAYFLHSYAATPAEPAITLAHYTYDEATVCAAVSKGAITGTQFHPEKSGVVGLRLLADFINREPLR